jgi:hypothetical protein
MPTYVFEDVQTGSIVEIDLHHSECGQIGDVRELEGRTLRRLPAVGGATVEPEWGHVAYGLSGEQVEKYGPRGGDGQPRVDDRGHAVFVNRREIEQTNAKLKAAGIPYGYDFGSHKKSKGVKL